MPGDFPVDLLQALKHAAEVSRLFREASGDQLSHTRRNFHPALVKILPALLRSLLALLPEPLARVHLESGQGPRVYIHPAGGVFAVCLLPRAVFQRIAGALA